jgi:RHS repeat-associated protein
MDRSKWLSRVFAVALLSIAVPVSSSTPTAQQAYCYDGLCYGTLLQAETYMRQHHRYGSALRRVRTEFSESADAPMSIYYDGSAERALVFDSGLVFNVSGSNCESVLLPHGINGISYGFCRSEEAAIDSIRSNPRNVAPGCSSGAVRPADPDYPGYEGGGGFWTWPSQYSDQGIFLSLGGKRLALTVTCPAGLYTETGNSFELQFEIGKGNLYVCPEIYTPNFRDDARVTCKPSPIYGQATAVIVAYVKQVPSCAANDNPCHPATGAKTRAEVDAVIGGLAVERRYSSLLQMSDPSLAPGWSWSHEVRLYFGASQGAPIRLVTNSGSAASIHGIGQDASGRDLYAVGGTSEILYANSDGTYELRRGGTLLEFDGQTGLLRRQVDELRPEHTLEFLRDAEGYVTQIRDSLGRVTRFHYVPRVEDGAFYPPAVFADNGSRLLLSRIELPDGRFIEYIRDAIGNLSIVKYPDGRERRYLYGEPDLAATDNPRLLTGIVDETGERYASFAYDAGGRVTSSGLHRDGNSLVDVTTLRYVPYSQQVEVSEPTGSSALYDVGADEFRNVTGITRGSTRVSRDYNPIGQMTSTVNMNGFTTRFEYSGGQVALKVEAEGQAEERRTSFAYDSKGRQTQSRVVAGGLIRLQRDVAYDANGAVTAMCSMSSAVDYVCGSLASAPSNVRQVRLSNGEFGVQSVDGPRTDVADITTYTYFDAEDPACASAPTTCAYRRGDLKSVTSARGHTTHFVRYDGAGRLLESRDANGLVSTFTYTPRGWLASRTVGGLTTAITYTPVGDVQTVTTPDGRSLTYTYDTARRLTAVSDQRGNRIEWTLDNAGNRTAEAVKDASGTLRRTLTQQFNTLGRLSQAANAAGQATLFTQDANGNLDLASDPLNRTTDQDVDALDRVTKQLQDVAGLNVETQFGYDALDQLTTVTDPKGLITRYTNDGLGNLLKLESPDTGTTTYTVDAAGNRGSQTDARGVTVNYAYDALNRPTGITFPTAALNTSFVYDSASGCPAGETFALGRLSSMTDASGSTRWCYDLLGRLTRKVQVTNGRTFTTAYAYDAQGRLSTQTLPSGAVVKFGYATGEVNTVAVRLPGSSVDLPLINGIERLPFGPVSKLTYGNGRTQTRAYDLDYAIDRITSSEASGWTQDYGVDAVGNLTSILGTGANNRFRYDGLDRLTHADNTSNVTQRQYPVDKTGNRTGKQTAANGAIAPYSYEATSHRLTQTGTEARTYDAVGNPRTIGARQLTYDDRSRLTVFVNGSTTRRYQYTGQGLRVRKWTSSNTSGNTYFVYNENAQLIGEYNNTGARVQEIIWLGNLPIGVIAGTAAVPVLHYIESDHLGTPRVIVEATRNVGIWRWNQTNDPFGESTPNQNPDGDATSFTFNLRFAGQYRDSESGWYYNVHRYYDPTVGRYLESDPIGLNGGISTYSYVGAAPLTAVDPLGLLENFTFTLNRQESSTLKCDCGQEFTAFSGQGEATNNPDYEGTVSVGPIPRGTYYIVDRPTGGRFTRADKDKWFGLFRFGREDGLINDYTAVGTELRGQFRLHPGTISEGCVTLRDREEYERLWSLLRSTESAKIPGTEITYYGTITVN